MTKLDDGGAVVRFRIRQNNRTVAGAEGPNAEAMIWDYAMQYRADGEVTIQFNSHGYWNRYALLCQWPAPKPGGAA